MKVMCGLIEGGVEVGLMDGKEGGGNLGKEFDDYWIVGKGLERVLWGRVDLKMVMFELESGYVG